MMTFTTYQESFGLQNATKSHAHTSETTEKLNAKLRPGNNSRANLKNGQTLQ